MQEHCTVRISFQFQVLYLWNGFTSYFRFFEVDVIFSHDLTGPNEELKQKAFKIPELMRYQFSQKILDSAMSKTAEKYLPDNW